jgi:sugar phosphate isomerase/epimerase
VSDALHPRVSVNGVALATEPVEPQLQWAAEVGVAGYGLPLDAVLREGPEEVAAVARATGISIAYLIIPAMFTLDRPERWEAETNRVGTAIAAAATLGTTTIYATTGPAGRLSFEEAIAAFAAAATPAARLAVRAGIDLLLEPVSLLRADLGFPTSLRDTLAVAAAAEMKVCADLLWCWRERDLESTVAAGIEAIGLVQVSDCEAAPARLPCRLVPGDGILDLERPLRLLIEAGYDGLFDVELLGPAIEAEGVEAALLRGARWTSDLLDRLGVPRVLPGV